MFEQLTPQQKQILKFGAPLVAAVAVGAKLAAKKAAPADPTPAPATGTIQVPTTDAIGVGQLASFEDSIAQALMGVQQAIEASVSSSNPVTPTPTPTPSPTPAPTPSAPAPAYSAPVYTALNDQQLAASRPTVPAADQPQATQAPTATTDMYGRPAPGPGWKQSGGVWYPPGVWGAGWYETNFQQLAMDTHGNPVVWSAYTGPGSTPTATVVQK